MKEVPVDLADTITLNNSGIDGAEATSVGSPPVWKDDSDATYVEVDGAYFGPSQPQFFAEARVAVRPQTLSGISLPFRPQVKLLLRMRYAGMQANLPPPRIAIELLASGLSLRPVSVPPTPTTPTWVDIDMSGGTGLIEDLWTNPEDHVLSIDAGGFTAPPGDQFSPAIRSWRFYEVRLLFKVDAQIITSRRKHPRSDGYGRGPRRRWPPENTRIGRRHGPETTI